VCMALIQRCQNTHSTKQACHSASNGKTEMQGRPIRLAADIREARHCLKNPGKTWPMTIWPCLAKTRYPKNRQFGIYVMDPGFSDTPAVQFSRPKILHQNIVSRQQLCKQIKAFLAVKIYGDATLVPIGHLPP